MRVIDLLNKIANDEEMDFEIIVVGEEEDKHYYDPEIRDFINMRTGEKLLEDGYGKFFKYHLHDTVEVIEENQEDEELVGWSNTAIKEMKKAKSLSEIKCYIETIIRTQNEIIEKINKD